jgi:hypothetical protein
LYFVLLPLPDLDDEKPLLHYLPHLQLGFCHDVYAPCIHSRLVYLQSVGVCLGVVAAMGDHLSQASRAIFHGNQPLPGLLSMRGEAVQSQKAAAGLSQKIPIRIFFVTPLQSEQIRETRQGIRAVGRTVKKGPIGIQKQRRIFVCSAFR